MKCWNTKFGMVKLGTLNPEHQIQNGKTQKAKSGTRTYRTVLSDTIAKPGIVKHGIPNLENYLQTMWTAPLRNTYNGVTGMWK